MISSAEEEHPITLWRRTETSDVNEIKKLVKIPQTEQLFGEVNVADLIEKSTLSLCQENSVGRIVSSISLCDHPNIPAVPSGMWLHWAKKIYRVDQVTIRNTLFIHLLVWNPNYSNEFLKLLLETVFIYKYYLQHILLVVPPGAPTADVLDEFFTRLMPINETECGRVQTLLICMREHHVSRLKIRKALEEDNDDLIPILDKKNEDLKHLYGDFYIAEMVQYTEYNRQMVVAEHEERAIGFLSMSTNIDFDLLNEQFEMAPFHGLRKPTDKENFKFPEVTTTDSLENFNLQFLVTSDDSLSKLSVLSTLFESESDIEDHTGPIKADSEDTFVIDEISDIISQSDADVQIDVHIVESSLSSSSSSSTNSNNSEVMKMMDEDAVIKNESLEFEKSLVPENIPVQKIPTYFGEANAFMVELFAMSEKWDERLSIDFLEAAFECYPELDYCIMTIPPTYSSFPLLEHFVRVSPRPSRAFPQELYVCHRNAVLSEIIVRVATRTDLPAVWSLISSIICHEQILIDFMSAVTYEDSMFKAYIILSERNLIGLGIVIPEDEILYLQSHYDVEAYVDLNLHKLDSHGILKHFTMSPIFSNHTRFFLKEIHRLSDYSCLYYLLYSKGVTTTTVQEWSLITALGSMIPVLPRHQIKYDTTVLEENIPCSSVLRTELPFALYHMSKRYCSLPKISVNTRIVVVGASSTALSFLETLLFGPSSTYLTFNNITVVARHGLPGTTDLKCHSNLLVYEGRYTKQYLAKLNLRTWINNIYGIMTAINRKEKYIVINDEATLQYDYLMVFCGEQFQMPPGKISSEPEKCIHGRRESVQATTEVPQNVFCVNTDIDACNALTALKRFTHHKSFSNIIVYGKCLEAYCCVAVLQEYGIPGSKICFVEPLGRDFPDISIFNDTEVDDAVMESMKKDMIEIYSGYFFVEWKFNHSEYTITSARFETKTKSVNIDCAAMFYYGNKIICKQTFLALERGQLVFDGRLVINPNFRSSDPCIYAAGPFTKYARRYYGERYSHCYYNSVEIGRKLGKQMLEMWNPTLETCNKLDEVPSLFKEPIIKYCVLPGKKKYLKIYKPGIIVPLEAAMCQDDYGVALVTGDCKGGTEYDYFKIHLNSFSKIETVTCYTKNEIDVENIISLYGLHEYMLNNMRSRFKMGYISDFYTYFREPWCYALIHDRFKDLIERKKEVFSPSQDNISYSAMLEEVKSYFRTSNWKKMSYTKIEDLKNVYKSQHENEIEKVLLQFLNENSYHLPMYAYPQLQKVILHNFENSPLFDEAKPYSSSESSEDSE